MEKSTLNEHHAAHLGLVFAVTPGTILGERKITLHKKIPFNGKNYPKRAPCRPFKGTFLWREIFLSPKIVPGVPANTRP